MTAVASGGPPSLLQRRGGTALIVAAAGLIGAVSIIVVGPRGKNLDESQLSTSVATPSNITPDAAPAAPTSAVIRPPAVGRYRFTSRTSSKGSAIGGSSTSDAESTIEIRPGQLTAVASRGVGGTYLLVDYKGGLNGQGTDSELYDATGTYLLANHQSGPFGTCVYAQPALVVPSPVSVGKTWSSDTECSSRIPAGGRFTTRRQTQGKVTGLKHATIGDASLETFVITYDSHIVQTQRVNGIETRVVIDVKETELFAPSLGLSVQYESRGDAAVSNGQHQTSTTSRQLQRTTPEPLS